MNNSLLFQVRYGIIFSSFLILLLVSSISVNAQDEAKVETTSSVVLTDTIKKHSPKLAAMLSAGLPGLGQAYNKKYWKIPIIYAGAGALIYAISFNTKRYNIYKNAYSLRTDGDSTTIDKFDPSEDNNEPKYLEESLLNLKDYYRRNRDVSYIFMGVLYMLNVVDAAVDGHFYSYEITDDLSLDVRPTIILGTGRSPSTGITLTLSL